MNKPRIGDLLLENGVITQNQLNNALAFQKQNGGLVGFILVNQKVISEDVLVKYLALQAERLTQI